MMMMMLIESSEYDDDDIVADGKVKVLMLSFERSKCCYY